MRRERLSLLFATLLVASSAQADDAGVTATATATATAKKDAGASDASPAATALPSGHPQVEGGDDEHAGHDHGHGGGNEMFQAPEDGAVEDAKIPPGTVVFQILDAEGKAVPNTEVTLGIIYNSVAKGESRKRLTQKADATGRVKFDNLDIGSGIAYRTMVIIEGATFSAAPFQLTPKAGMRGQLHVYPLESDVEKTLIVSQSMVYTEVKDDRVQVQQAFTIYNFGKNAWVPQDVVIPLPPEYTAFSGQQGMTDVGVDALPKRGVKLRGTFAPGEHTIEFRWQLPYNGEPEVIFDAGVPPHMAAARVIAPAARNMTLDVDGFPAPRRTKDGMGQPALLTEKQLRREDPPVKSMRVQIHGLPTEGPAKIVASLLAACGVALGLVLGTRKPPKRDLRAERARLLADLESLERAHAAGDVGPKTYERARRDLLDDIARTFAAEPAPEKKPAKKAEKGAKAAD